MPLTYFYAELLGIMILVTALSMLVNRHSIIAMIHQFADSSALTYITGIMGLFLGLVIVLTHNIWDSGALAVVVTIIGWALLLKSIIAIFLAHGSLRKILDALKFEQIYYFITLIALVIGIYLTYYGFFAY